MKKIFGIVLATFAIFGLMIVLFSGGRDKVNNASAAGIVLVQKAYNAGSNAASMAATFTSPVQSGNLLVVSISSWPATPSASPIKDSLGNTFSAAGPLEKTSGGGYSQIFYAKNIIGGTDTVTFSVSSSGSALSIAAAEFSGLDSNAPLDTTKGAIGGSNSPSTGSFTPTASGDLLIGAGTHDAVVTTTAGTGFTMIADATEGASGQQPLAMEYQILSGSAATSTSFKLSSSTSWAQNGALFKIATGPADTTPPTVSIAAPTSGSNVSGTVSVSANASDNVAVASVQFQIDGTNFGNAISTAPYQISWDTTKISNGSHTLTAIAKDTSNNSTTSAPISVNVTNAPIISGVNVSNLATTSATINWTTNVATNSQVNYGLTSSYGSTTNLDSALVTSHSENISGLTASTTYHYQVVSSDSNGVTAASTDFTFSTLAAPDTTPPTVSIAAPTSGSNVSGTISVSANASDNVAVASVQFQIDGTNLGSAVTTAPYTIQWDTTTVQNGAHTLTAIAKDTSNNSATSNPVSVTVANPPTISAVNATAISSTAATITWSTNISANSQVNYGLTSSYGSTTNLDSALVTSHSENISGLTASTTYHYQVLSTESVGDQVASTDFTFTTAAAPDTTPPTVSLSAPSAGSTVAGSTVMISANASDNVAVANVQFQIDGTNFGSAISTAPYQISWDTTKISNGSHSITAVATDTSNNSATSNPVSVTVANPPTISNVSATAITKTSATITWTTNVATNSQVNYGLTSSYGSSTNVDSALVTSHSENISGLTASTTYHYQVVSADGSGLSASSNDFTFTTQSNAPAAIKLVQQASGVLATGSKITATLPTAVQAGDTLVVSIASWPNPPLATSVTDSLGNTYVDATPIKSTSSSAFSTIYYAKNVKPGTDTATFSLSTNTNSMTIIVAEFSGADPNNPLDAAISSTGSSKTPASGNMTPSMAGDVAIGSGTHDATTVTTVATGFTMVANATENASVDQPLAMEYQLQTGTAVVSAKFNLNTSTSWVQGGILLKPGASVPDTIAPTVPTNLSAAAVSPSQINLTWTASTDNVAVTGYNIFRNGTQVATSSSAAYSDKGLTASTTYSYNVSAFDAAGNVSAQSTTAQATTPTPDTVPPTVALTAPLNGSIVSGLVSISANASDNVAVANVQFQVDGGNIGAAVTSAPYTLQWNSASVPNGSHVLTAIATDTSGNVSVPSTPVSITVNNAPPTNVTWEPIVNMNLIGYSDSYDRSVVRTNSGVLYYVLNASGIKDGASSVKVMKGNSTTPTAFAEMDSAHEPKDSTRVIGVDARLNTSTGIISIVYQLTTPNQVTYNTFDTNTDTWGTPEVVGSVQGEQTLRYLSKISLALDSSGVPHVTYGGANEGIIYKDRTGGSWGNTFNISSNFDDMHTSMVFDTNGVLHLAWFNFDGSRSILYRERSASGVWSATETVDGNVGSAGDKVDQSPSIAIEADGLPIILYHEQQDSTVESVRIMRRNAPNSYTNVSPSSKIGNFNNPAAGHSWALSVDSAGNWYMCGHGAANSTPVEPQCVWWIASTNTWNGPTLLLPQSGLDHDGSASMRFDPVWYPAGSFQNGFIDVAYHDENTPPDSWFFNAIIPGN